MMDKSNTDPGSLPAVGNPVPNPSALRNPIPFEGPHAGSAQANGHARGAGFNIWIALDLLARRWHWLVISALICGAGFYLLGWHFLKPKFTASAQLIRYEPPGRSDYFKTTAISPETFAGLIRTPELLRRVGNQIIPPIPPETFVKFIKIDPEADSDIVHVQLAARDPQHAVDWLNLYLTNAVEYTRTLEATQAGVLANSYLNKEVSQMDEEIKALQDEFRKLPTGTLGPDKLSKVGTHLNTFGLQVERLQKGLADLDELRLKFTDQHPTVQAKLSQIEELKAEVAAASANTNSLEASALGLPSGRSDAFNPEIDILHTKLRALEDGRVELIKHLREAQLYAADAPANVRVLAPADLKTVKSNMRSVKIGLVTVFGGGLGLLAGLVLVLLVEFLDDRLRTADDVIRVTNLPLLSGLGNLRKMDPQERARWAFRAWTMLQGRLSPSPNHGLVCGITSSAPGEGRSTWISLLAEAASLAGFRVLTIATRPSPSHVQSSDQNSEGFWTEEAAAEAAAAGTNGDSNALTTSVLSCPAQVASQFNGPGSRPVVHIPLPGWVWNLERRKQWNEALEQWRQIDNLVILVELPPASVTEAVLLGSNIPNLVWLANSGTARAGETRAQIETLRHARCNLVGALLNRETGTPARNRFPRWLGCLACIVALGSGRATAQEYMVSAVGPSPGAARTELPEGLQKLSEPTPLEPAAPEDGRTPLTKSAQDTTSAPVNTVSSARQSDSTPAEAGQGTPSFSIVNPAQRAAWQQHLTLGAGDVLTFNLYGQPELTRAEVPIGPDGRVSYLEATEVLATGLTIDELRAKIDQELGKFRRAPRTMITPIAYRSKRYFVLGKVTTKGAFILDRPLTVLEALARAHGLESALVDRNLVDLTDFQRSFLARNGRRFPLDFENLFQQGDLSKNISIEPGDYIFFASGDVKEVYVVGEVRLPGPATYTSDQTVIGAITARGGYTERAFKARVLVVRGSLDHPEAIAVDTHAVLDGKGLDFKLRPRDIIYVNSRPFIKVEEAADLAATAFIQAVITSWVGVDIVKPFK